MKRLALFGGTFNPVHNGHVNSAAAVLEEFSLDHILFVPSKIPVHKEIENDPGPYHRLEMLRIALRNCSAMSASPVEIEREESSYSVITVQTIRDLYKPETLFFVLGADSFNTLRTWREYVKLCFLVPFIVLVRPGDTVDAVLAREVPNMSTASNSLIDISSTMVRGLLREKKDCTQFMDNAVLDYISENSLYN